MFRQRVESSKQIAELAARVADADKRAADALALSEDLRRQVRSLESSIDAARDDAVARSAASSEEVARSVDMLAERTREDQRKHAGYIDVLRRNQKALEDRIAAGDARADELSTAVAHAVQDQAEVTARVRMSHDDLGRRVDTGLAALTAQRATDRDEWSARLGGLDERSAQLESAASNAGQQLAALRQVQVELDASLRRLETSATETRVLADTLAGRADALEAQAADLSSALEVRAGELSRALDDQRSEMERAHAAIATLGATAAALAARTSELVDVTSAHGTQLAEGHERTKVLAQHAAALEAQVAELSTSLGAQLAELSTSLDTRTTELAQAAALMTAGVNRLGSEVDALRDESAALTQHSASVDEVLALQQAQTDSILVRIEPLGAAMGHLERLDTTVSAIDERLTAAELLVNQRDDLEMQLERAEEFERTIAEIDPDRYASREEVDELRSLIEQIGNFDHAE